jgi:5-methylcytosine-specific restriction endonuclease McrA
LRLEVLNRDRWRCQIQGERCQGMASVVDHIIPVRAGGPWWDKSNL